MIFLIKVYERVVLGFGLNRFYRWSLILLWGFSVRGFCVYVCSCYLGGWICLTWPLFFLLEPYYNRRIN